MTTGATVNELARILKLEGVERVDILTLARAGDNAEFVDTP
jgi:predicted amidophosphoribosyltransferase